MKKLVLSLMLVCGLLTTINAQEVGQLWVSGSVGFNTSKVKDGDRLTNYRLVPEIGYQFADDWGIGIQLGYAHNEFSELNVGRKMKMDGFTVEPFVRYSFLKGNIGCLFVDGGAGYTYGKNKTDNTKLNEFSVGLQPGVCVNVADNISLTGKFGFLGYQYEKLGNVKTNSFGFDFDMKQVELGVSIIF